MKRFITILTFFFTLFPFAESAHAGGGHSRNVNTVSSSVRNVLANALVAGGLQDEAQNVRDGNARGEFVFEEGVWKYVFIIMKMMIAINLQGVYL